MFDTKGNVSNPIPIETVQDPKTGETVHRVAVDAKLIAEIDKTIQTHQQTMNAFVMNSQNFFMGLKAQLDLLDKIKLADDAIKKTLTDVTKKSKLDPKLPWAYNMQLKTFERRTPPIVQGMTQSEIEASKKVSSKPQIVSNSGVGVK